MHGKPCLIPILKLFIDTFISTYVLLPVDNLQCCRQERVTGIIKDLIEIYTYYSYDLDFRQV